MKCVVAIILTVSLAVYFLLVAPYHLFFKEQISLFICNSSYLYDFFQKPAFIACAAGDFLTQFCYLSGGGAVVCTLLILTEWFITAKVLNLLGFGFWSPIAALFPACADWMLIPGIYFPLSGVVSLLITLSVFLICVLIRNKILSAVTALISVCLLYYAAGFSAILFPLLITIYEINNREKRLLFHLILFAIALVLPYLTRTTFLLTLEQAYIFPHLTVFNCQSLMILAAIALFALIRPIREMKNSVVSFSIITCLALLFCIGGLYWKTDGKTEKLLELSCETYFGNTAKVLKTAEKERIENPIATYYANLAMSKTGVMGDKLMSFYQPFSAGLFLPVNPQSDWFSIFFSNDAYFYVGDMNMAQHSAMLGMMSSPWQRSSRLVRRLAEINVATADTTAAMKYIRMLNATVLHKKYAKKLESMLFSGSTNDFIHKTDVLVGSQNPQPSLELLVNGNPDNRAALDYLLSFYLLNKDISSFKVAVDKYIKGKKSSIPKVYEEALLIALARKKAKQPEVEAYGIKPATIRDFERFTALYESSEGSLSALQKEFANTYWLYFQFAKEK
ncbi:MAG: DUF6057 family protein [Dysgonamonadaceae bacterium]|jgi:hypothetical protein|nr:DUF6057 family protein [Dysgonamonadaceae bacterium]